MIGFLASIVTSSAGATIHRAEAERRRKLGLPPVPPPSPPTKEELRSHRIAEGFLWFELIVCGALFCSPWIMLLILVYRFTMLKAGVSK